MGFINKYGVTGLAFKIDTIDDKKWVKSVAMQQNSATLIYDLNTMKDTVENYLKRKSEKQKTSILTQRINKSTTFFWLCSNVVIIITYSSISVYILNCQSHILYIIIYIAPCARSDWSKSLVLFKK